MEASRLDAEKDGVVVPETLEEYCIKTAPKPNDDCTDAFDLDEDYYDYGDESGMSICLPGGSLFFLQVICWSW